MKEAHHAVGEFLNTSTQRLSYEGDDDHETHADALITINGEKTFHIRVTRQP